jgi:tetratricopeptide (TPR) repeat protein
MKKEIGKEGKQEADGCSFPAFLFSCFPPSKGAAVLLLALAQVAPTPALAQPPAEVLVERAVAAYKAGDYSRAGALFFDAYELSKASAQLRNAAKAYQKADDLERAEDLWSRYLELDSISGSERSEAEAQLALIEERRKAATAEEEARRAREEAAHPKTITATIAVAPPTPAAEPSHFQLPAGPIVMLAIGAASAIGGAVVYTVGNNRLEDLDDKLEQKDSGGLIIGIHVADAQDDLDSVNRDYTVAAVLGSIAGAALITGAVWWLLDLEL